MPQIADAVEYRWEDLPQDRPMDQLTRRRIIGEKVMMSEVFLHKGCHVPTHAHENEQFAYVMSGEARFGVGAEGTAERRDVVVKAGGVLHLPSMVPHSVVALEDSVVLDVFAPPSEKTGIDG